MKRPKAAGRSMPGKERAANAGQPGAKLTSFKGLNLQSAAAAIGAPLEELGHDPVLVGQACAAIYAGKSIRPSALEFVIKEYAVEDVNSAMQKIGFRALDARTFANNGCPFEVVLNPTPIAVGDDIVDKVRVLKTAHGRLKLLTPTDCVRHRLSNYYRFGDRHALVEAVRVARRQRIDMDLVRRWSEWEWATDRFEEFLHAVGK